VSDDVEAPAIMVLEMPPTEGPTLIEAIEAIEAAYRKAVDETGLSVAAQLLPYQRAVRSK
jgi:hypothetical protein